MILEAAGWCLIVTSPLIIGAWIAFRFQPSSKIVGLIMGFGAGALIAAVAYELFPETSSQYPLSFVSLGLGAILFYLGTSLIERRSTTKGEDENVETRRGKTIVLGALLDGIPESLVLGMSFAVGGTLSIAFFGAVLASNLPEGIAASSEMVRGGVPRHHIFLLWLFVMLICVMSTIVGVMVIQIAPSAEGVNSMAMAGGAVLAMLADSMIPEGFQEGGRPTGLIVVLGFAFAALLGVIG
jgi:ZIP family zinc transporter